MNFLEIQRESAANEQPNDALFQAWVDTALAESPGDHEIVIRLVDEEESAQLNQQYRHKTGPTNVLSFPFEAPPGIELDLLGDLVLCAPVIAREAAAQGKPVEHHWAHITIHGVLHLQGYDHLDDEQAEQMEALEIKLLKLLNIANPYLEATTS